jgi:hypothetical protein
MRVEPDLNVSCSSVFNSIADRLLRDPVDVLRDLNVADQHGQRALESAGYLEQVARAHRQVLERLHQSIAWSVNGLQSPC